MGRCIWTAFAARGRWRWRTIIPALSRVPDVLVLSKAIGGGLPLAVILYRAELDRWQPSAHAGTFRGNQLAMAAGLATLRFIQSRDLFEHVRRIGRRFEERLSELMSTHSFVGDVRGRGLMLGMEIVNPEEQDSFGSRGEPRFGAADSGRMLPARVDRPVGRTSWRGDSPVATAYHHTRKGGQGMRCASAPDCMVSGAHAEITCAGAARV